MRLINTETLELAYFGGEEYVPGYAILSHVWTKEEVSFQDMMSGDRALVQDREGYRKIEGCCAKALSEGFSYIWVDTCCIDKTSSAELSEAINSMFRWYREASVCYAYLADVSSAHSPARENSQFRRSKWFTRGWTLQELLAPYEVVFLAKDWRDIGTKRMLSMAISQITNINEKALTKCTWDDVSIAGIMSWASGRKTTRVEDQAYCLMGIFQVNMPLIYGEGSKAFYRLQMEIMKFSNDESIFAWSPEFQAHLRVDVAHGLLAPSPAVFAGSSDILAPSGSDGEETTAYDTEKQHVRLSTKLVKLCALSGMEDVKPKQWKLNNTTLAGEVLLRFNESIRIIKGIDEGLIITPTDDLRFEQLREICLLAVLRCTDSHGAIAIPIQALPTGGFERVTLRSLDRFSLGWFRINWKPMHLAIKNWHAGLTYELRGVQGTAADSVVSMPTQSILIRAEARGQASPWSRHLSRHLSRRDQEVRIDTKSFSTADTGYYISSSTYPRNPTVSRRLEALPNNLSVTSLLFIANSGVIGLIGAQELILFVQSRYQVYDRPSFALRFQMSSLGSRCEISYFIGPAVDAWGSGLEDPHTSSFILAFSSKEYGYTKVTLARDRFLVFRARQGGPETPDFVNISIDTPPVWDTSILPPPSPPPPNNPRPILRDPKR